MKGPGGVLVYSEREEVALELLAAGRMLADPIGADVTTLLFGRYAEVTARDHIARGADEALIADVLPASPAADLELEALQLAAASREAAAILIGATVRGTEIAARLAQRLRVGCASDCTGLSFQDGKLLIERRTLGRFVCRQVIDTRPAMATLPPRRYAIPAPDDRRQGGIERLSLDGTGRRSGPPGPTPRHGVPGAGPRLLGTRLRQGSSVRVDRAEIVVAVGRGLRKKEDLRMIEDLALALGGAVGASRPLTDDLRWLPPDAKIGLSGETVRPKLYIACGISGQIEHNVGMRDSGVVVAINSDRNAPIMEQADYRVTGDLYTIVPALIRAVSHMSRAGEGAARPK